MALAEAIELNFVAVECLQDCNVEEALCCGRKAWDCLRLQAPDEWIALLKQQHPQQLQLPAPPPVVVVRGGPTARDVVFGENGGGGNKMSTQHVTPTQSRSSSPLPTAPPVEVTATSQNDDPATLRVFRLPSSAQPILFHRAFTIQSVSTDINPYPVPLCNNSNVYTLYSRAFEFDTDDEPVTNIGAWWHCVAILPVVIAYNTGLGHHIQAVQQRGDSMSYHKAQCMYLEATICLARLNQTGSYDTELDILCMALYNNMAHCNATLKNMPQADAYLEKLRTAFAASTQRHHLTDDELYFFQTRLALRQATALLPAMRPLAV